MWIKDSINICSHINNVTLKIQTFKYLVNIMKENEDWSTMMMNIKKENIWWALTKN